MRFHDTQLRKIEGIILDVMDDYGFRGNLEMDSRGRTQSFIISDYRFREKIIGYGEVEVDEFAAALEDSIQDYLTLSTYYFVHVMVENRDIHIDFTN